MPGIGQTVAGGVLGTRNGVIATTAFGPGTLTNYLEDDFGDSSLTNRSNTNDGVYASPQSNVAGDVLIGRYRPEWEIDGSPSVTSGKLRIDAAEGVHTNGNITPTSFSFDIANSTIGADYEDFFIIFMLQNPDPSLSYKNSGSHYSINIDAPSGGQYNLKSTSTTIIGVSWAGDTVTHSSEATRDSYGNFELFLDGTSKGTATDTATTEPGGFAFEYNVDDGGAVWDIDNLVVK